MNNTEKKFARRVLAIFYGVSKDTPEFTREENLILERWRSHKIITEDAFFDVTSGSSKHKEYIQSALNYPFTALGDKEINEDWYLQFRNSRNIILIRDTLTFIAFSISLYLAISKAFQN
jgi:hypothetical protein